MATLGRQLDLSWKEKPQMTNCLNHTGVWSCPRAFLVFTLCRRVRSTKFDTTVACTLCLHRKGRSASPRKQVRKRCFSMVSALVSASSFLPWIPVLVLFCLALLFTMNYLHDNLQDKVAPHTTLYLVMGFITATESKLEHSNTYSHLFLDMQEGQVRVCCHCMVF